MSMSVQPKNIKHVLVAMQLTHTGMSQAHIADILHVSPATVCRLLKSAGQITELRYKLPPESSLESRLMSRYKLRDAVIVETGLPEAAGDVLGQIAATYFTQHVQSGTGVALSCGETLLKMLQALPFLPKMTIDISQLSIEGDTAAIHQAPSTLVGLLKAKVARASRVRGLQLPPLNIVPNAEQFRDAIAKSPFVNDMCTQAKQAQHIFIGIGTPLPRDSNWAGCFHQIARAIPRYEERVKELAVVGEINNQLYDAQGRDCTEAFEELSRHFINILSLANLSEAVRDRDLDRRVIALATGRHKMQAIKAALKGGLVNVLISGKDDAEELLKGSDAHEGANQ